MNITLANTKKHAIEKAPKKKKVDWKVLGTRILVGVLAVLMVGGTIFSVIAYM